MIRPAVSVVVANYNNGPYLREALDSVLAQTFRDYEIVVADDGSTDDSCAIVDAFAAEHPGACIRLLRLEHTGEPALTRNAGIAAARAELVANLDGDDLLDREFLERCIAALRANPLAGVAYSDQHHFGAVDRRVTCAEFDFDRLIHGGFFSNCAVFRKEAFDAVGGYVPDLGYEDWDLWIGFAVAGWPGVKARGALFHYRVLDGGRHVGDASRDKVTKARIVLRRPALYSSKQLAWARGVLAGDPHCLSLGEPRGAVPAFAGDGPTAEQGAALAGAYRPGAEPVAPRTLAATVLALDHAATIAHVLDDLAASGAAVTVLDLGSCDATAALAQAHRSAPRVERAGDLRAALRRAEELAAASHADWQLLQWGDEFRESPWPDLPLAEALGFVDALGDNAVAFETLRFPTGSAPAAGDPRARFRAYERAERPAITAWKRTGVRVRLADAGGEAFFCGRRVSPMPFLARSYPAGAPSGPLARYDDATPAALLARAARDLLLGLRVPPGATAAFATRALALTAPLEPSAFGRPPHAGPDALALALIEARAQRAHARLAGRPAGAGLAALERALAPEDSGLRSFVTLAAIDDLLRDPELMAGYVRRFGAGDDATLVVHAPAAEPDALNRSLLGLLDRAGVAPHDAPDILALTCPAGELDATAWHATLTGAEQLDGLRRRAERAWTA
ncbi:glycosyltransferase family A protein [Candidatus Solirubrobacter pratensis]|uniref:glycosyltransferase family A protein n=1 Tax=Candidatus Solirubrobacter pratensis TaxID=1298857 RepID=UPI00040A0E84|nr:glycosyltransferase family A protein [Candidatus Solirubrobacter pratensis]